MFAGSTTTPNCAAFSTPRKSARGTLLYEIPPHPNGSAPVFWLYGRGVPFRLPCGYKSRVFRLPAVSSVHQDETRKPGKRSVAFARKVVEKKHASSKEYLRHGRVFHLFSRDLYEVIGRENDRFRRALSTKSDLSGNFQRTRTHGARRIGPDSPSESTKPLPSLPVFHFLAEHYPKADFGADAVRPKSVNTISHVEHVCALTSFRVSVPKSRKTSSRSTFRDG